MAAAPDEAMGRSQGLAAQARDFAPDLLTLEHSPPSRMPRVALWLLMGLLAALLAWALLARLDIVASAQGRLVPLTYTKVVQPAEAGVVAEILVREGDEVRAGQTLLRLDARVSRSDVQALGRELAMRRLNLRRIEAELAGRVFVPQPDDPSDLAAQVLAQSLARQRAHEDARQQEEQLLHKARSELASAQQLLVKLQQTVPLLRQSAQAHEKLRQEGFVGEVAANEKKREALEREQDLLAQQASVQGLQANVAQSQARLQALGSSHRAQLENERIETLTLLNRSQQEHEKFTIRSGLLEVQAPSDGVVKDLAVTTPGAVVQAGALLMNLVPQHEPLQAEVLLNNEDVGFVVKGQMAHVKVAAYPFQKYGLLQGEVELVSADALDPVKAAQQGTQALTLTYRALIRLPQQRLLTPHGTALNLSAGMGVTVDIHQGRRTVMEYLLSPVRKLGAEAARER